MRLRKRGLTMIKTFIFCAANSLICYIVGFIVGRKTSEQALYEKRSEMGLDDDTKD